MLEVTGLKISINRGDTGSITVTFTGQDVPPNGTRAKVSLQKTLDSEDVLWSKILTIADGRVTIPILSEDTDYSRGNYLWVLRLLYENGDVYTPMEKPQPFVILPGEAAGGDGGG